MRRIITASVLVAGIAFGGLGGFEGGPQPAVAQADLPPAAGGGEWLSVFRDEFERPHPMSGKDMLVENPDGTRPVVWTNRGTKDMSQCATVGTNGVLSVHPWRNDHATDPKDTTWRCRLTSLYTVDGGTTADPKTHILAARVKFHSSRGHLSSFWANGSRGPVGAEEFNEIDVIENEGASTNPRNCKGSSTVQTNNGDFYGINHAHYSKYKPDRVGRKHCLLKSEIDDWKLYDGDWHTVHVRWTPGQKLVFFIDQKRSTAFDPATYAKDIPVNLVLTNIDKLADGTNPTDFKVDWVRVWQQKAGGTTAPDTPPAPVCDNDCYRAQLGGYGDYVYRENSNPSSPLQARIIFDKKFYLWSYPDVQAWANQKVAEQGGNAYDHAQWHWLNYGIPQGRQGSATFDPVFYMNNHPDIVAAFGWNNYDAAIRHYVQFGRFEGRRASHFFDPAHYKARYGDMAGASNAAVIDHFTVFGMDEGRQGSAEFGPAYYLGSHADLRAAYGKNYRRAMAHWNSNGRAEGRKTVP